MKIAKNRRERKLTNKKQPPLLTIGEKKRNTPDKTPVQVKNTEKKNMKRVLSVDKSNWDKKGHTGGPRYKA